MSETVGQSRYSLNFKRFFGNFQLFFDFSTCIDHKVFNMLFITTCYCEFLLARNHFYAYASLMD